MEVAPVRGDTLGPGILGIGLSLGQRYSFNTVIPKSFPPVQQLLFSLGYFLDQVGRITQRIAGGDKVFQAA
jgi:hypothetical protein